MTDDARLLALTVDEAVERIAHALAESDGWPGREGDSLSTFPGEWFMPPMELARLVVGALSDGSERP